MSAPYSAKAIANYFLALASKEKKSLSPMKLQKLVYFAHGWYLAIHKKPLITEEIQAWKYGPVVQSVYHEFKKFGSGPITIAATALDEESEVVTPEVAENDNDCIALLNTIWKVYGNFSAIQLSNMTHEEGTPWAETWKDSDGLLEVGIDNNKIRDFFVNKAKKNIDAARN